MCLGDGVAGHLQRHRSHGLSDELSTARSERGPVASGRGRRCTCIGRAHPPSSVRRGPDSERIRAFFISDSTGLRIGTGQRSMDRTAGGIRPRRTLFNNLPRDDLGTGRWFVLHLCGCSSAGRARPRHGRGHEFETRHPLHFGCVQALRGGTSWCRRRGMCAALVATCSETPRPTGRSRPGTAEVDFCRVRLVGRGHRNFNPGTRVRLPHAMPGTRSPRGAHASRAEIGRNDWAAPEPVTGWISVERCRFKTCQRRHATTLR